MRANICSWGSSAGVRIPKTIMQQIGVSIGDAFEIKVSGDSIVLRPYRSKLNLNDLMKQCDLNAPPPDMNWWDNIKPVGQEVL